MRRDYFTVDIQASATDNDDPTIEIVYDGPTGELRERLSSAVEVRRGCCLRIDDTVLKEPVSGVTCFAQLLAVFEKVDRIGGVAVLFAVAIKPKISRSHRQPSNLV